MPSTSNSEQLFGGSDDDNTSHSSTTPIDSATMLLSVVTNYAVDLVNHHLTYPRILCEQAETKWQAFVKSSWAKYWLPELKYLHLDDGSWTLGKIAILAVILALTCSWYTTIRNDNDKRKRKSHERTEDKVKDKKEQLTAAATATATAARDYWETLRLMPTLNIAPTDIISMLPDIPTSLGLSFSTGSSLERRLQTMAMFSCSLAFVMPGVFICWANVIHFGILLPLDVFILNNYDTDSDNDNDNDIIPAWYQLRTASIAIFIWMYMIHTYCFDLSPTTGSRNPWLRGRRRTTTTTTSSSNYFGASLSSLSSWWWNHACDYLPVVLVKTAELPATTTTTTTTRIGNSNSVVTVTTPSKYVLGYHPHGIIAVGAFCAFATDGARVLDLSSSTNTNKNDKDNDTTKSNYCNNKDGDDDEKETDSGYAPKQLRPRRQPLRPSALSLLEENNNDDDDNKKKNNNNDNNNNKNKIIRRGFSSLFPNLDRRVVTLPVNFGTPFLRDYFLAMGAVTSHKETFRRYLNMDDTTETETKSTKTNTNPMEDGRAIVVVVGGAAESMMAHEGHMELVLNHRRGFVREAIMQNANLVPVLGFGETNLYTLYDDDHDNDNDHDSNTNNNHQTVVSRFQNFVKDAFGVAVPLFTGRGVFFKGFGVMPRRSPVVVVVGKPIPPPTAKDFEVGSSSSSSGSNSSNTTNFFQPKIDRTTDTPLNDHGKILIEWHAKYVQALEELYHEYKDAKWNSPGQHRRESMTIVR